MSVRKVLIWPPALRGILLDDVGSADNCHKPYTSCYKKSRMNFVKPSVRGLFLRVPHIGLATEMSTYLAYLSGTLQVFLKPLNCCLVVF